MICLQHETETKCPNIFDKEKGIAFLNIVLNVGFNESMYLLLILISQTTNFSPVVLHADVIHLLVLSS